MSKYIHLQGIGCWKAKAVKELCKGDAVMWNYGYMSTVLDILPSATGKTAVITLQSCESGKVSQRRMSAETLVGIYRSADPV